MFLNQVWDFVRQREIRKILIFNTKNDSKLHFIRKIKNPVYIYFYHPPVGPKILCFLTQTKHISNYVSSYAFHILYQSNAS